MSESSSVEFVFADKTVKKKNNRKRRYYKPKPKVEVVTRNDNPPVKKVDMIKVSNKTAVAKQSKAASKVEQQVSYEGVPIGVVSRVVTPADIVLFCQWVVLKHFMDRPSAFTYPATSSGQTPTFVPPTPSEMVAYYVAACVQQFYRASQIDTASTVDVSNKFPNSYAIPNELAHWIKYQVRYGGANSLIKAETRLVVAQDFLLSTAEVLPTSSSTINPYNLSVFCVTTSQGVNNVGIFPITQGNANVGDVTLYLANQTYSGLYEGADPFISSSRVALINTVVKRNFGYVKLEEVSLYAPDMSAYGVGVSVNGAATQTGWSNFTAIMNNTDDFDEAMTPVLRPNLGAVAGDLEVAGSFLGSIRCVPMGTQLICSSAQGIPVVSDTPMEFQYIQQFIWIAQRNKYFPGKCFGKRGFTLSYDGKKITVPKMCDWVARTIDYNLIMRRALEAFFDYINLNIQSTPPTSDTLCNFVCCVDSMLGDRVQTLGNCLWGTGNHPSTSFVPQSLVANRCSDLPIPLFLKAILDQVGPAFCNGTLLYPIMYLNCGSIQLTNNTGQYWSKFGLLPNTSGNRFEGLATNSTTFSNSPFQIPVNSFFYNSSSTFTPYAGAGGYSTNVPSGFSYNEIYLAQLAASNASTFMTNALALPLLNGYSPNFVYWFNGVAAMWDGVMGYMRLRSLNAKAVTGTQHLGWGGPGMLATVIWASQVNGSTSQTGSSTAIIDTTGGTSAAFLIQSNVNNVYDMWAPRRLAVIAPMCKRDAAIVQAYGPCSYYVLSGSTAPADVRSPVFVSTLVAASGIQVYKAFTAELIGTETALINAYMRNKDMMHRKMGSSSGLEPVAPGGGPSVPTECLKLPFTSAADSISAAMESVDEWTSIIPVPAVARSIWNISSKVLHHYSVYGSKVNEYFKNKRRKAKAKEAKKQQHANLEVVVV